MATQYSIKHFVTSQVIVTSLITMAMLIFVVQKAYWWGVDDTTHYYLYQEAKEFLEQPSNHSTPASEQGKYKFSSVIKSADQLPTSFTDLYDLADINSQKMLIIESETMTRSLTAYSLSDQNVYVIHDYEYGKDDFDVNIDLNQLAFFIGMTVLILALIQTLLISKGLINPIYRLSNWAKQSSNLIKPNVEDTFVFKELDTMALQLHQAALDLQQKTDNEKAFISTLSHELRTPISVIKGSLSLLERKKDSLETGITQKLERIKHANNTMLLQSQTMLWLWRDIDENLNVDHFNPYELITSIQNDIYYLIEKKDVLVTLDIDPNLVVSLPQHPVYILASNLLRNAYQYTEKGGITIRFTQSSLVIANSGELLNDADQQNTDYGYGIGHYLCQEICKKLLWVMSSKLDQQNTDKAEHCTVITFSK